MILFTEHDGALPYTIVDVCQRLADRAAGVETGASECSKVGFFSRADIEACSSAESKFTVVSEVWRITAGAAGRAVHQ